MSRPARRIAISLQHFNSRNPALRRQERLVHAVAAGAAGIGALGEFVDHHALASKTSVNVRRLKVGLPGSRCSGTRISRRHSE